MKNIFAILMIALIAFSCKKEDNSSDIVSNAPAPSNIKAVFDITTDNTGMVSIIVTAEGATHYMVLFGDDPYETPTQYNVNEEITHVYGEGVFNVVITAVSLSGKTTEYIQEITVAYKPPENLMINIEQDDSNPFTVHVSATAEFATVMDVYFGEDENEEPVHVLPDSVASHTYQEIGEYFITVIAKSAGSATTSKTDTVLITGANEPVTLPIDFESMTVNYAFTDFDGTTSSVIDNPDPSGVNTSSRVAQSIKGDGAQTWAGSYLTLGSPIDFSVNNNFKVLVWSPKADAVVKLKVENKDDGNISYEMDQTTTTSNQWEELVYDFSAISLTDDFQKVVIFFDFGNPGDGTTYYFDDIRLVPGNLPEIWPIEDFEGELPEITSFGNIADVEVVANPDPTGANTTNNVAKMTKTAGSETWAGAFFDEDASLDLVNYSKIKVDVWSPNGSINVLLKLEDLANSNNFHEVSLPVTTSNEWEELTFDFSDAPDFDYGRVVIFFDFGNPGDDSVYYYDEFELTN
ncbi:MAG: hypothetical protein KDC05_14330 [Bacteroidales bacterium]|nr:hypothetical protein [Bacteroidales bacterium]